MEKKFIYLPIAINNATEEDLQEPEEKIIAGKYPCPCCGYLTLPVPREEALCYICPVCFWENDVFITSDDEPSDENHGKSLNEAKENYKKFGAVEERFVKYVRAHLKEEIKEKNDKGGAR